MINLTQSEISQISGGEGEYAYATTTYYAAGFSEGYMAGYKDCCQVNCGGQNQTCIDVCMEPVKQQRQQERKAANYFLFGGLAVTGLILILLFRVGRG